MMMKNTKAVFDITNEVRVEIKLEKIYIQVSSTDLQIKTITRKPMHFSKT